jgi:hypothetical protein
MDDAALHGRLDRLERRLLATLGLLVGLYVVGGVAAVVWAVPPVTPWHGAVAVVALGLAATVVGTARRRRART